MANAALVPDLSFLELILFFSLSCFKEVFILWKQISWILTSLGHFVCYFFILILFCNLFSVTLIVPSRPPLNVHLWF